MKAKLICGWIIALFVFCQPVFAVNCNVLDENLYYGEAAFYSVSGEGCQPVTKIISGNILCHYSVVEKEQTDAAVIAALYKDGFPVEVKAIEKTDKANGNAVYNTILNVPDSRGYEIRMFLVNDLSVSTPMKRLERLSEKSNAKNVTGFTLDGISGRIDNSGSRISVLTPPGTDLSAVTAEAEVSDGAEYTLDSTDFSGKVCMTVTAEDKSVREYIIETSFDAQENLYDFEDFTPGKGAEEYDEGHWTGPASNDKDISESIKSIDGNNMLCLTDNSTAARADVRVVNWNISAPFTLSCRISYRLPEGVTERTSTDDYSYCTFFATNENKADLNKTDFYFCGFEPVWGNDAFYFNYYKEGKRTKSSVKIVPSAWYDVTMQYYQGKDGLYYVDYTITDSDGKQTEFKENPSGRTETVLTGFYLLTSPGRRAEILLDDVNIKEDTDFGCEMYEQNFNDGYPDGWSGGSVTSKNGSTVLSLTGGNASADIPQFIGNTSISFDICTEGLNQSAEIFSFGAEDKDAAALYYSDGKWAYNDNGTAVDFDDLMSLVNDGETCRIKIDYVYDAVYDNYRADYYANGVKLGSVIPENELNGIDYLRFTAPQGGNIYIGNVLVEKL